MSAASVDTSMNDASDSDDGQELLLGNEKKLVIVGLILICKFHCYRVLCEYNFEHLNLRLTNGFLT